ncbi:uncharacterized protein SCHCODRAFT_02608360 [Schizophyllum commune H4-8]|uniref:PWWP domain-containing protein n=1 Tax=Schizophyllum commune (strain H4-8 / FGSC 9210) TaxID=578458 RepID=D8PUU5_SCHCM|nr:uncharacterized protein SCHCODRAFT_02608360 [Schizophyllum commune H4-8]KAI5900615.1 hypothetical protein SCHCODRAFT_02608360 [Schizophyllum commune H4-8]
MSSRRAAAQRAQVNIAAQADSDSDTEEDELPRKPPPKSQTKGKGHARRKSLADVSASSSSLVASRPALPPKSASARRPARAPRSGAKRGRSPDASSLTDVGSDADMTSLSSSPHSTFTPGKMMRSKAPWSLDAIRQDAWVLIDMDGHPVDGEPLTHDRSIWWPAKIVYRAPLTAHLYGDHHREHQITIRSPSPENIMSFLSDLQTIPFTGFPWIISSAPALPISPRKRRKTNLNHDDVQNAWYDAAATALKHYLENECDGFPPPSLVSHELYQRSIHIGSISEDELDAPGPSQLKPKETTENYEYRLGNEPILAQDKGYFWPARVLDMFMPEGNQRAVRFRIEFCDRSQRTVTKKQFYDQTDPEFLTCKMGDIDSGQEEPDDETLRTSALDAERSGSPEPQDPPPAANDFCDLDLREQWVYAKPVLQAILRDEYAPAKEQNFTFFASDTGRKKLTEKASARGTLTPKEIVRLRDYILEWCLRDAKHATRIEDEAIDAALEEVAKAEVQSEAGPPPPSQLEEDAVSRPSSTQPPPSSTAPSDPGDDTRPASALSNADTEMDSSERHTRPPPQRGSEAYELLSPLEKLEYCMNILLPAAVQQLLIWRSGDRRSTALLSPEEEARLYKLGVEKSKEQDWVVSILEFRKFASRVQATPKGKAAAPKRRQSIAEEPLFSASGRPKRQVTKGQSFRL